MEFVPLWTDILDRPNWKILDLPPELFRFWVLALIAAQKHDYVDGHLPDARTLAHWLGMARDEAGRLTEQLVAEGLLDRVDGGYRVHDWNDWRCTKDPGAVARQRKSRANRSAEPAPQLTEAAPAAVATECEPTPTATPEPVPVSPADLSRIEKLAEELMGDVSWAIWAGKQAKLGAPDHAIRQALEVCVNKGIYEQRYAGGVLKDLAKKGYPVESSSPSRKGKGDYKPRVVEAMPPPMRGDPGPQIPADEALAILTGRRKEPA